MRKLLFLISVIITVSVFSQDDILPSTDRDEMIKIIRQLASEQGKRLNPNDFIFGVGFNPAISWLNVNHDDLNTDGATITAALTFNAEYKINKNFSVASGLVLGIQGGYVADDASISDLTTKSNFLQNYYTLEIPMLAKFTTVPVKKISYYGQAGLVPGVSLASREFHTRSSSNHVNQKNWNNNLSEPFILSWQVGIGTRRAIWKKSAAYAEINFKSSILNLASEDGYILDGRYTTTPVPIIHAGNMFFSFGLNF